MRETIIRHIVTKEKEGTYYTIPFSVPAQVEAFTLTYAYPRTIRGTTGRKKAVNVIDLGILDCDGKFMGWSGSARRKITVGEFSSTHGYFCQPVKAGQWQIVIGAYKIAAREVVVEYTITFEEKGRKLYYGDLHVHSTASDGKYTVSRLGEMAQKAGLHFIAVSDHNNYCENFALPRIHGLSFLPAVEWTHYKGHMNFYGVKAPFANSFVANTPEEMKALVEQGRALGAVISVNHPECGHCPYLWEDQEAYDMMEIWNGPMRAANYRAIEKWTGLLASGRKIPAVGGSDFHRLLSPVRIGHPVNGVYSEDASPQGLLAAIRAGHLFIASSLRAPALLLTCGDRMMGDTVTTKGEPVEITVKANRLCGCRLFLVTAKGEKELTGEKAILPGDSGFAYIKAVKYGIIRAITNPVYLQKSGSNSE